MEIDDIMDIDLSSGNKKVKKIVKIDKVEENTSIVKYELDYYINMFEPIYFENILIELDVTNGQIPNDQTIKKYVVDRIHKEYRNNPELIKIQRFIKIGI